MDGLKQVKSYQSLYMCWTCMLKIFELRAEKRAITCQLEKLFSSQDDAAYMTQQLWKFLAVFR